MAKQTKDGTSIEFNEVRAIIRKAIDDKFGGVAKFLHSSKGEELGGDKIKVYLYDTGPVNFDVISELCNYFGLGKLSRQCIVSRRFAYRLNTRKE